MGLEVSGISDLSDSITAVQRGSDATTPTARENRASDAHPQPDYCETISPHSLAIIFEHVAILSLVSRQENALVGPQEVRSGKNHTGAAPNGPAPVQLGRAEEGEVFADEPVQHREPSELNATKRKNAAYFGIGVARAPVFADSSVCRRS